MRLMRLAHDYPSYLKQFYTQHPGLEGESYSVQYQKLKEDCFLWADFWTHALGNLGYEVWEPVGNAEPMQRAWAEENGLRCGENTFEAEIVTAQVKQYQPDVVLLNQFKIYHAEFLKHLRSECSSIRLVLGWCGSPYKNAGVFAACDLMLSNIQSLVKRLREDGHRAEYMRHCFSPRVLDRIDRSKVQTTAFSFVGSIIKRPGFHNQREELVRKLVRETELEIWSDIRQLFRKELWSLFLIRQVYDVVQMAKSVPWLKDYLPIIPKIRDYVRMQFRPDLSQYVDSGIASHAKPALYGLAMYQKLYESEVTLNTHIDVSAQEASNMRLYEATGVGTCLLTDWKANLCELFEPDVEVVTYRSPEEAVEKVQYLLRHEEERRKIAAAGQRRTLRSHTYNVRAQELDALIRRNIK